MNLNIFLIILSPYTAFIPLLKGLLLSFKKRQSISFNPLNIGLLFLFFWSVISSIENHNPLAFIFSFGLLGYFILTVWIENNVSNERMIELVLSKVWHISLFSGAMGIIEKVLSQYMDMNGFVRIFWNPTYYMGDSAYRILSTFGNPNIAGDWFAAMIIVGFLLKEKGIITKRYALGNLTFAVCLFLTGSKGAFLGFIASLLVIGVLRNSKKMWVSILAIGVVFGALLIIFPNIYETINPRNIIWEKSIALFEQKPLLGWGFMGIYSQIGEVHSHNIWLSMMTALGIVGLLVFIGIQTYVFASGIQLVRQKKHLAITLLAIQVVITVHGLFDFTLFLPQIGIMYYSTAAFISALAVENRDDSTAVRGVLNSFRFRI